MRYITIIIVICLWIIVSALQLVNPLLIPSFFDVIKELFYFFTTDTIIVDLCATTITVVVGFFGAILLGMPVGFLMGYFTKVYKVLELPVDFLRSIPATALFPLFIVLLGIGNVAKIWLVVFACALVIIVATANGVKNCKEIRKTIAITMKATKYQIFSKIIFFETLPELITGLKIAFSISIVLTIVAEMFIGTQFGLGKRIYEDHLTFEIPRMYATIILVGMAGYASNKIISYFQQRFVHWAIKR